MLFRSKLGQLAVNDTTAAMPDLAFSLEGKGLREWIPSMLDWLTSMGKPLLVGIPLLAILLAAISYPLVRLAWRYYVIYTWHHRRARRMPAE